MKQLIGTVASVKMNKTVIVEVSHDFQHPLYQKRIERKQRYACHNESLALAVGDTVKIAETKPVSRTKHFKVLEKIA